MVLGRELLENDLLTITGTFFAHDRIQWASDCLQQVHDTLRRPTMRRCSFRMKTTHTVGFILGRSFGFAPR